MAAFFVLAGSQPCAAEGPPVRSGLWEVVTLERAPGSDEPLRTERRDCVRDGSFETVRPIPQGCTAKTDAKSATTQTWLLACRTNGNRATGTAEMTVTDESAHGGSRVTRSDGAVETAWSARRLGPCEQPALESPPAAAPKRSPGTRPLHAR